MSKKNKKVKTCRDFCAFGKRSVTSTGRRISKESGRGCGKPITPQVLLPFEWDKQKPKTEFVSKEEDKNRLESAYSGAMSASNSSLKKVK